MWRSQRAGLRGAWERDPMCLGIICGTPALSRRRDPATFVAPPRVDDIVVFSAHTPFELHVTAEEIAAGFYTTLGSLQGRNHTFYNGAAFDTHDSSLLWQFTKNHVLPLVLA